MAEKGDIWRRCMGIGCGWNCVMIIASCELVFTVLNLPNNLSCFFFTGAKRKAIF
jgi:hypothetical protein